MLEIRSETMRPGARLERRAAKLQVRRLPSHGPYQSEAGEKINLACPRSRLVLRRAGAAIRLRPCAHAELYSSN